MDHARAAPTTPDTGHGKHAHGRARYFLVWGALLVLTVLTVLLGQVDLGPGNLPVALVIASVKAGLVALFFMHLWEAEGVQRLVFVVSVLFVVLLALGVLGDYAFRLPTALPPGARL